MRTLRAGHGRGRSITIGERKMHAYRAKCFFELVALVVFFTGCTYVPPSKSKADWFATVEASGPGKLIPVPEIPGSLCLEICSTSWEPLLGVDGPGGRRTGYEYWSILEGDGPVFKNPVLHENGFSRPFVNLGTITIDKKSRKVVIDLRRVVSKPDEPERTEPSPANGTYPLKRWIK